MELTFPFKNWAINSLLGFLKIGKIKDFADSKLPVDEWASEDYEAQSYSDRIADFENEMLQVINTSN